MEERCEFSIGHITRLVLSLLKHVVEMRIVMTSVLIVRAALGLRDLRENLTKVVDARIEMLTVKVWSFANASSISDCDGKISTMWITVTP